MKFLKKIAMFIITICCLFTLVSFVNVKVNAAFTANDTTQFAYDVGSSAKILGDWTGTTQSGYFNASSASTTVNGVSYDASKIRALRLNTGNSVSYSLPSGRNNVMSLTIKIYAAVNGTSKTGSYAITAYNGSTSVATGTINIAQLGLSGTYEQITTAVVGAAPDAITLTSTTQPITKVTCVLTAKAGTVLSQIDLSYNYDQVSLTKCDAPTNVEVTHSVNSDSYSTTVAFDSVAGAGSYDAVLYSGSTSMYTETNIVSGGEIKYYVPGTYTIKVKAVGNGTSTSNSDESVASSEFTIHALSKTISEINTILDGTYSTDLFYRVTGIITEAYNYNGFDIAAAGETLTIYGGIKTVYEGSTVTNITTVMVIGNLLTVEGNLEYYQSTTKEIKNAYLISNVESTKIGAQVSSLDEGKVNLRLVGALLFNYQDLSDLSFVITDGTDASKTTTKTISTVFDTLSANVANGVVAVTAVSQDAASLFAFTITQVPVSTVLKVKISFTTVNGTFTSAEKTITVETDGTIIVA